MNDSYIEQTLLDAFLTLNDFSGIQYITFIGTTPANVALPNKSFTPPADKRYFRLSFMSDEPVPAGLGSEAYTLWTTLMQIDLITPLGTGLNEVNAKYEALSKLFTRGKSFEKVTIKKTYKAQEEATAAGYRRVIRIEANAFLPQ